MKVLISIILCVFLISISIGCSEADKIKERKTHQADGHKESAHDKHEPDKEHHDHDSNKHKEKKETDHSDEKDHDNKAHLNYKGEKSHDDTHHKEHSEEDSDHDKESDEHGHHEENKFGDNKAVIKADEERGIQLADHVLKLLKIETQPVSKYSAGKNVYRVPKPSLVYFEDKVGIYYERDGWYNLQKVKIRSQHGKTISISTKRLKPRDKLVISGLPLLRLSYLEAFGASGEGHGH